MKRDVIDANSEYLRSKVIPKKLDSDTVVFHKRIIFEEGASFAIEVLLLHPKDVSPFISPVVVRLRE